MSKDVTKKKPTFRKKDGSEGPGRLFARKGEDPKDARKRLGEKYKVPKNAKFDEATNSFSPAGRDPAFPKKSKDTGKPDGVEESDPIKETDPSKDTDPKKKKDKK